MPLCLHQVKGKHWKSRGGGLDWIKQSRFTVVQSRPVELQRLFRLKKSNGIIAPAPALSYPAPLRTPCCRTAAVGPGVSACAPQPRCPCYPRCRDGGTGDTDRTGWGRGRWEAAGWGEGPRLNSGSLPQRRRGWPDRDPGKWYLHLHY